MHFHDFSGGPSTDVTPPALLVDTSSTGIVFTGREPVDAQHPITISITNLRPTTGTTPIDLADITVGYGGRAETVRSVTPTPTPPAAHPATPLETLTATLT